MYGSTTILCRGTRLFAYIGCMLSAIRARLSLDGQNEGDWIAKIFPNMPDSIRERTLQKLDVLFQLHRQDVGSTNNTDEGIVLHCHTWARHTVAVSFLSFFFAGHSLRRHAGPRQEGWSSSCWGGPSRASTAHGGQGHSLPSLDTA
jgi:hypothetical protein